MNPLDIIAKYYPVGSEAYRILVFIVEVWQIKLWL